VVVETERDEVRIIVSLESESAGAGCIESEARPGMFPLAERAEVSRNKILEAGFCVEPDAR
jgi:hypothetical protein